MDKTSRAVIFANGDLPDPDAAQALLKPDDRLIAADGGMRHMVRLGLMPALLVGDLDSLAPGLLPRLESAGARTVRHPSHKDETDLELALRLAVDEGYRDLLVVGGLGGRLDHTLGNLSLLRDPALHDCTVRLDDGLEEVFWITGQAELSGAPGDVVSLLPLQGDVSGVTTQGLEYPLHGETLYPYKTRGISNVMITGHARVVIASGSLLCVHTRQKP
ncbi:MAG: thiamine diphosphokinase [Anaerolineaceae bacterium]|nr:thiamine diphosphokinase [Anaerolineaceae bacterium]